MEQRPYSLKRLIGKRITAVARVFYEHAGHLDEDGPLELGLDGQAILFDGASDGESLRVRERPWTDPFEEPLSDSNRAYVPEHGRWRRVDCSRTKPYADLCGHTITDARILVNEFNNIAGVRISASTVTMWFVVQGDECHVYWAHPIGFSESRSQQ